MIITNLQLKIEQKEKKHLFIQTVFIKKKENTDPNLRKPKMKFIQKNIGIK